MQIFQSSKMFTLVALCCLFAIAAAGPPVLKTRHEIEEYKNQLEKSIEDDGLTLEERMEVYPQSNAWENSGKFQGDMLLDDEIIDDMVNSFSTGSRMAYIRPNRRWPQNTVVYEFGHNEFNLEQQRHIIHSINLLQGATCLRFRLRNNNDRHWVRLTGRPTGCYASVGWYQNRQISTMNLARNRPNVGCFNTIVVIHEWYHVLGFFHMQSTYNRYNYVRIHWNNITPGMAHNFYHHPNSIVSNLHLPYEYGSCMHYGTHFFSRNGQPTISTTRHYGGQLGQTVRVTGWDVWRLARHYNCPGAWSAAAMDKARTTAYEVTDDGSLAEIQVEPQPLADELPLIHDDEDLE